MPENGSNHILDFWSPRRLGGVGRAGAVLLSNMVFKMSVAHCLAALNVLIAIPGILLVGMGAYLVYLAPALEEPDGAAILSQLVLLSGCLVSLPSVRSPRSVFLCQKSVPCSPLLREMTSWSFGQSAGPIPDFWPWRRRGGFC